MDMIVPKLFILFIVSNSTPIQLTEKASEKTRAVPIIITVDAGIILITIILLCLLIYFSVMPTSYVDFIKGAAYFATVLIYLVSIAFIIIGIGLGFACVYIKVKMVCFSI